MYVPNKNMETFEFHKNKMVLTIMDWQKFSRYILNTTISHFLFLIHYLVMIADKKN